MKKILCIMIMLVFVTGCTAKNGDDFNADDSAQLLGLHEDSAINLLGKKYKEVKIGVDDQYDGYYYEDNGLTIALGDYNTLSNVVVEVWFDNETSFKNLIHGMKTSEILNLFKDEVVLSLMINPAPNWYIVDQDSFKIRVILDNQNDEVVDQVSIFINDLYY